MMNQEILQSMLNNPQAITFSEGKSILSDNSNFNQFKQMPQAGRCDASVLCNSINFVKNIKATVEIINYLINYASEYNAITFIQNVMEKLFINYKHEDFKDNKLLNKYNIKKLSEEVFLYKIGETLYSCKLKSKKTNMPFVEKTFLGIEAIRNAINIAINNNHDQIAEELIKDVLKIADVNLTLFLRTNYSKYNKATKIITGLVSLLEPEAQIHAFKILEKHCQQDFCALSNFSNALLSKGDFDKVIKLLETKLLNIDNEALTNEHIDIGCYYNLGLAYYSKINYQAAKKYYLSALKYLPNDQDTILELIKICLSTSEVESAKNYIKNLESKDIKNLLEMTLDLSTIFTLKLESVKNKPIPESLSSLIPISEYIAKFNEGKLSNKDEAFKAIYKKCNNHHSLLSTAIHTKQYDFIKKIVRKIPKEVLFQNKAFWKFRALFGLEEDIETLKIAIDNNNLERKEAADLINISSTVLIANEEFNSVPEKVENALKYDPQNEEALEIGVAAALLDKDKEKAQGYLNQLSEEKQQEIAVNYNTENIEQLIKEYDAKEIHAHYQRVKQQKLFEISQKITNNQIVSNWNVNKQIIKKMILIL